MNLISVLDLFSFLGALAGLAVLRFSRPRPMREGVMWTFTALMLVTLLHSSISVIEWSGTLAVSDAFEDGCQLLLPMSWGLAFYTFVQDTVQGDLRDSEQRLALVLEAGCHGAWEADLKTGEVHFSPRWLDSLGYKPEEAAPHVSFWKAIVHPDTLPRAREALRAHLEGRAPVYECETRLRTKWGTWRWTLDRGRVVEWDTDGRPLRLVGTETDITERKEAEEALRESEERFRSVVESSGEGILAYDTEMRLILWNSSMERISGIPRAKALGRVPLELFPCLETVGEADAFREAVKGRSGTRSDMPLEDPRTGWKGYFESVHFPVRDSTGQVKGGMGIIRDITERKRAEEEVRQAKENAEAANRAKSEFLANMSHELRTPMSGVIGGIRLLLDTPLTAEQHELAEVVRVSGEAQLAVINNILDFSKIEAGKLTIDHYPFDLRAVVEEVEALLVTQAEEKGIEFGVRYGPDVPRHVVGDPERIGQVIANLVGNAVKFTGEGHVLVTVTSEDHGGGSARVRVTVEDTGIGITEENASHLFDKFTQADSSTTRRFGGTGLGLAICKHLVELMGGQIGVASRPGGGSTFWFTLDLPLATQAPSAHQAVADACMTARPRHPTATTQPISARVLVADDNMINRKVAARMLEKLGCHVHVAATGKDAVEMLSRFSYDLVFMDCLMPEMDGFEATDEIRRLEAGKRHVPIVAMTALATEKDSKRCLAAGMDGCLDKPVTLEAFRTALEHWTQTRTRSRERKLSEAPLPSESSDDPPPNKDAASALDPAVLSRLRDLASGGDDSFLDELFSSFLDDATATIDLLRQAARSGDAEGLAKAAHSLKGSSGNVGACSLADICERLETLGKIDSLARARELIDQLEQEFGRVKGTLSTWSASR